MFNVALISRWHVHAQGPNARYTKQLLKNERCKIKCVFDDDEETARAWGEELGVDWYTKLEDVLLRDDIHGVVITSETSRHKDIMIAAARHGKHIFTEKALTFNACEAYEIKSEIEKSGVKFCIAYPHLATKQFAYAKTLAQEGTLGDIVLVRCLVGHDQGLTGLIPEYWYDPNLCGGGAMMDLGYHAAYLAGMVLGKAKSVSSTFTYYTGHASEDTATCSVIYENGAQSTLEATFVSPGLNFYDFTVYGTKGTYHTKVGKFDSYLRLSTETAPRILPYDAIPDTDLKSPLSTWVDACIDDKDTGVYGIDAAIEIVKLMEAAYKSAALNGARTEI